jgi:hypothetical protein
MKKYDRLAGVPPGYYYLVRVIQFSDFEVPYKDEILFVAKEKVELVDLCKEKQWYCSEYNPQKSSWLEYAIQQHKPSR